MSEPTQAPAMRAIDKIRAALRAKEVVYVDPAWPGVEFHFTPLTTADIEAVEDRKPKTPQERNLLLLIHKARDAAGQPLFAFGEMSYLKNEAELAPVTRVLEAMFGAMVTPDEAKAAVEADPSSGSVSA